MKRSGAFHTPVTGSGPGTPNTRLCHDSMQQTLTASLYNTYGPSSESKAFVDLPHTARLWIVADSAIKYPTFLKYSLQIFKWSYVVSVPYKNVFIIIIIIIIIIIKSCYFRMQSLMDFYNNLTEY